MSKGDRQTSREGYGSPARTAGSCLFFSYGKSIRILRSTGEAVLKTAGNQTYSRG